MAEEEWGLAIMTEAQILSDLSMMAPCLIMPSVWPVFVCTSEALVTSTGAAIMIECGAQKKLQICKIASFSSELWNG